jgi:hypothetical protein
MRKEQAARLLTLGVLAAALGFVVWRNQGSPMPASSPVSLPASAAETEDPQSAIYAMLDAAREGKPAGYLASFTGQLETQLRQAAAEQGEARFAQYLRDQNAAIKGVALSDPQSLNESQTKVRLEYVYQDRNEVQWVTLERTSGGWKITRIEAAERVKTLVPYGTPVN